LARIKLAKEYIPRVMVEMPVIPGTLEKMKSILNKLERIGIHSINLLEFCFPFNNVEVFNSKGFKVKERPYKILYNYWYAGGLSIAGSELECIKLLKYCEENDFKIGVHYCSLENKHTGQIYQQNFDKNTAKYVHFSQKDFFHKTAKVFGEEIDKVLKVFKKKKYTNYSKNDEHDFLEFHPNKISWLNNLDIEIAISSNVMEVREDGLYQREVSIELTSPKIFNYSKDM